MNRLNQVELQAQEQFAASLQSIKNTLRDITSAKVTASLEEFDAAKAKVLATRDDFAANAAIPALNKLTHELRRYLKANQNLLPTIKRRKPELLCPEAIPHETLVKLALKKHLKKDDFMRHSREHLQYILDLQDAIKEQRTLSAEKYDELCDIQAKFVALYKATLINPSYEDFDQQLQHIEDAKLQVIQNTAAFNQQLTTVAPEEELRDIETLLRKIADVAMPSLERAKKTNVALNVPMQLEQLSESLKEQYNQLNSTAIGDDAEAMVTAITDAKNLLCTVELGTLEVEDRIALQDVADNNTMQCLIVSNELESLFNELDTKMKLFSQKLMREYDDENTVKINAPTTKAKKSHQKKQRTSPKEFNMDHMLNPPATADVEERQNSDTEQPAKLQQAWLQLNNLAKTAMSYTTILPENTILGPSALQKEPPKAIETTPAKRVKKHAKKRLVTIEEPKVVTDFEYQFDDLAEQVQRQAQQCNDRSRDTLKLSNAARMLELMAENLKQSYRAQLRHVIQHDADDQARKIVAHYKTTAMESALQLRELIHEKIKIVKAHNAVKREKLQQVEEILVEVLDQKISVDELANNLEKIYKTTIKQFNKEIDEIIANRDPNSTDVEAAAKLLEDISQRRAEILASQSEGNRVAFRCNSPRLFRKFGQDVANLITKENAEQVVAVLLQDLESQQFNSESVDQDLKKFHHKLLAIKLAVVKTDKPFSSIDAQAVLSVKKAQILQALNHEYKRVNQNQNSADNDSTQNKLDKMSAELKKTGGWFQQIMEAQNNDDLNKVMESILKSSVINQRRATAFNQSIFGFLANLTHTSSYNNLQKQFKIIGSEQLSFAAEKAVAGCASAAA